MGSAEPMGKLQRRRLHPCLCGYRSKNYSHFKRHQDGCAEWQNRPNPRGLSVYRRAKSRSNEVTPTEKAIVEDEYLRRTLEGHGIHPRPFAVFLRLLALRYRER